MLWDTSILILNVWTVCTFLSYVGFFVTYETGEQIHSEREDIERKLLDECKEKLVVDSKDLEDPFDIKKWLGWKGKWHKVVSKVIFDGYYSIL